MEIRPFAERIEQWIGRQVDKAGIAHGPCALQSGNRFLGPAPLCKHFGLLVKRAVPDLGNEPVERLLRLAAIAQGVYARSLQGNASSDDASTYGAAVKVLAELACSIAGVGV